MMGRLSNARFRWLAVGCALLAPPGCSSNHAAMNPAGPRARSIAELMLGFVSVSTVVYLIVSAVLVWAIARRRRAGTSDDWLQRGSSEQSNVRSRQVISWATALTVLILLTLALCDYFVMHGLSSRPTDSLRILVTGHQYWWEVEYDDPDPSRRVRTANELHIPVGKPVELVLTSQDVIHSMWMPNLSGKKDLIPGHQNTEVLLADRPGTFSGQCAEFCGLQHAKMRLMVYAEPPKQFAAWKQAQLQDARNPSNDIQRHGLEVFESSTCILCHTIQGTQAAATVAPDLTHLASRTTIAAGALPNTQSNLASWILAPHRFKPGVQMPATQLQPDDLAALAAYLASLK